ncbi:helix-turn-helix domain-containing protein [Bacillus pretiosus]
MHISTRCHNDSIVLAELTGIRPAAISELYNNQRKSLNKEHIDKIITALNITDINELITIVED